MNAMVTGALFSRFLADSSYIQHCLIPQHSRALFNFVVFLAILGTVEQGQTAVFLAPTLQKSGEKSGGKRNDKYVELSDLQKIKMQQFMGYLKVPLNPKRRCTALLETSLVKKKQQIRAYFTYLKRIKGLEPGMERCLEVKNVHEFVKYLAEEKKMEKKWKKKKKISHVESCLSVVKYLNTEKHYRRRITDDEAIPQLQNLGRQIRVSILN